MKITRSTKCSLKFMTQAKRLELDGVLAEYGKVVNHFIDLFWSKPVSKTELLKDIVNSSDSWLSARLKKVAAREALDMVSSVKLVQESNKEMLPSTIEFPVMRGNRIDDFHRFPMSEPNLRSSVETCSPSKGSGRKS